MEGRSVMMVYFFNEIEVLGGAAVKEMFNNTQQSMINGGRSVWFGGRQLFNIF
jgi:hypothetical protein